MNRATYCTLIKYKTYKTLVNRERDNKANKLLVNENRQKKIN